MGDMGCIGQLVTLGPLPLRPEVPEETFLYISLRPIMRMRLRQHPLRLVDDLGWLAQTNDR